MWLLSILEWRAGNWDVGARHASDLLALRAQFGREGAQPIAEMPAAMIAAHQGQVDEARERSLRAIAVAEAHDVRIAQSGHRCVLGFIELSLGDPAAALVYLERPGRFATTSSYWSLDIVSSSPTPWRRWSRSETSRGPSEG